MQNNLSQQTTQKQLQQLNHIQRQGLDLLKAPLTELESMLTTELESNPLLEVISPAREEPVGDPFGDTAAASNELSPDETDNEDGLFADLPDSWSGGEYFSEAAADQSELQQKHDFLLNSLTVSPSLTDLLFEQLSFCNITQPQRIIAEQLIGSLDDGGFLTTHTADIAMQCNAQLAEVEDVLQLIQSFDPPGVGARSLQESLTLQLQRNNYPDKRIYRLLNDFSEELERNKLPQIAKAMQISIEQLYEYLHDLKKLNRTPAAGVEVRTAPTVIIPEMSIENHDGELIVSDRKSPLPKLGKIAHYEAMLQDPDTPEETRKYLKEKLLSADNLLKMLEMRQSTLLRITEAIKRHQKDFLLNGINHLTPMSAFEIAQELELDDSTVSRAISGKYLETPQGVLEYKFFFSGGYTTADGEDISSRGVKEKIRELIAAEDSRKPLSDEALSKMLSEHGLNVARRTVAKYRESLNIPPTNLRRHH